MRTQSVANLVQGVSQQAAQQRRDTQCQAQFDCFNTAADGAGARPPSEVVKVWPGRTLTGAYFAEIIRDGENYVVGVYNQAPFGINLDTGVDCAMAGSNSDGYLNAVVGLTPRDQFRAQVVEDTTFLVNREAIPLMDPAILSATVVPAALVFVRSGAFDTDYKVTLTVGGTPLTTAVFHTPDSDAFSDEDQTKTSAIAEDLKNDLDALLGVDASRSGSTIYVVRTSGGDFEIATEDGNGDEFMYAFKDKVSAYSKLPARGYPGFTVEVVGESRRVSDNFFVQFTGPAATGYWKEVVKPGIETTLKPETMPHTFVNTGPDAFTYGPRDWSTRIAGDEETAKTPSFVGKKLRDIFYHKNRLGVLWNGGANWSKSRFPFTFFPDTAQTVLDTAPIDTKLIAGPTARGAATMDFAVQIDESLSLWAQRAQFRVSSGQEVFKQDTIEAPPSTAYEYAPGCDPLALGTTLYFVREIGPFGALRALQYQGGKVVSDVDVSRHVPTYIRAGVRWITGSDTLGCTFLATDGDDDVLYCYNFLIDGQEYAQSAWNTWRLPGGSVLWASMKDNYLRVFQQRPEGVALVRFNLTPKAVDEISGATYLTRLDMRVTEAQVTGLSYSAITGRTSFTLPYTPTGPDVKVIVAEDEPGGYTRGREFNVASVVGAVVYVDGDLTGYKFYVGQVITATREETRFYERDPRTGVVVTSDRLTVDEFTVEFADTGYTRIEVATPNKPTQSYPWEGRTIGLPDSMAGTPRLGTATKTAPVRELAENATITLVNDSYLPSYWQAASYGYTAVR